MTFEQAVNEISEFHSKVLFNQPVSKTKMMRVSKAIGVLQSVSNLAKYGHYDKIFEYVGGAT